jgi:hypothetical protein
LAALKRLPEALTSLAHAPDYPVTVSDAVRRLAREVDEVQSDSTT